MPFYDQLEKLCKKNGVKPSNVVELLGMSKGTMSNWKKGGTPSGEAVVRFAKHFGVSTDYLLLGVEPDNLHISSEDAEWLELIHKLPEETRRDLLGYLRFSSKLSAVQEPDEIPLKRAK
jgi:transcriptional regulator with XRE-family HTH domain